MCMTLLLSEPMTRAIVGGPCKLEWSNFTECVVTYVVTRTKMRFSGVISTAVLHYVEIRPETRMSVYIPQLCLGLLVMMVNGWLLVSLQGKTQQIRKPVVKLIFSLVAAYCLHGAITVYIMTSLVASSLSANPFHRSHAMECVAANGFLVVAIASAVLHHIALAADRFHNVIRSLSYRMFWTSCKTWILIGSIWTTALTVGFLPAMGWKTKFQYCMFFYQYFTGYFVLLTILFFVALLTSAIFYSYIVLTIRKPVSATFNVKASRSRQRQDERLTNTAAILAVVSFIFWTPLFLHLVLACPGCVARSENDFVLLGVFAFALTNALISPLIYAFRIKQLRHLVSTIVDQWRMCKLKRRSGNFELSTANGSAQNRTINGTNGLQPTQVQRINSCASNSRPVIPPQDSRHGDMLY